MSDHAGKIWIITGDSGAGKTRFCSNLVLAAKKKSITIKGLICPAVFEGGQKTSIQVVDLETGEQSTLATARKASPGGSVTDHWKFNKKVMIWSNRRLASLPGCDLAIVDELGPLEFNLGRGWQQGLKFLDEGNFHSAVVVIRLGLVETAQKRWPKAKTIEIPARMDAVMEERFQQTILDEILKKTS